MKTNAMLYLLLGAALLVNVLVLVRVSSLTEGDRPNKSLFAKIGAALERASDDEKRPASGKRRMIFDKDYASSGKSSAVEKLGPGIYEYDYSHPRARRHGYRRHARSYTRAHYPTWHAHDRAHYLPDCFSSRSSSFNPFFSDTERWQESF